MRKLSRCVEDDWESDGTILRRTGGSGGRLQGKSQAWIPAHQGSSRGNCLASWKQSLEFSERVGSRLMGLRANKAERGGRREGRGSAWTLDGDRKLSPQAEERNARGGSRRMASIEETESRSSKALQGD